MNPVTNKRATFRIGSIMTMVGAILAQHPGLGVSKARALAASIPRKRFSKYEPHQGAREKARRCRQRLMFHSRDILAA